MWGEQRLSEAAEEEETGKTEEAQDWKVRSSGQDAWWAQDSGGSYQFKADSNKQQVILFFSSAHLDIHLATLCIQNEWLYLVY